MTQEELRDAKYFCYIGQAGAGKEDLIDAFLNFHLGITSQSKVRYTVYPNKTDPTKAYYI